MDVEIGEVVSTVRTVSGEVQGIERLIARIIAAMEEREAHNKRVRDEQRITGGVREELEEVD